MSDTTWYLATRWSKKIEPLTVESETAQTVVARLSHCTTRLKKESRESRIFPTRDEAVAWKMDSLRKTIEYAKRDLAAAQDALDTFCQYEVHP